MELIFGAEICIKIVKKKSAIIIINTINHGREWQEVMEHLAIKDPDGK